MCSYSEKCDYLPFISGIDLGHGEPEWIVTKERSKWDVIFHSLGPVKVTQQSGIYASNPVQVLETVKVILQSESLFFFWGGGNNKRKIKEIDRQGNTVSPVQDKFTLNSQG
jgi:hypothetical protein